ncbi:MAG: hypothetical protein QW303_03200 [Nitrososphaerota archaeon]
MEDKHFRVRTKQYNYKGITMPDRRMMTNTIEFFSFNELNPARQLEYNKSSKANMANLIKTRYLKQNFPIQSDY